MNIEIAHALGGLGLFLLGITIMTDGLKLLAGPMLKRSLTRFTVSPVTGAITGTVSTAILQSSSATTVAAIGFVSASLLTFPQALGIIFGANLGTTVTGWIVALVGFKLQLGELLLPAIFIGMLLRLFGRGRMPAAGLALAGFGLIFVGIDSLQAGMASFEGWITPATFPTDSFTGIMQLVLLGLLITVVTQSSSAGVATALAALNAETINFHQAAALVIGMDVGSTATAILATLGGSVEVRRTGYSHVIFNVLTACGALLLLTPYIVLLAAINGADFVPAELALVGFHTSFNLLGVLLVLPFAQHFANLVIWLVPDKNRRATDVLDKRLLAEPDVALEASRAALTRCRENLAAEFDGLTRGNLPMLPTVSTAGELSKLQHFLDELPLPAGTERESAQLLAQLHVLDHLKRLVVQLHDNPAAIQQEMARLRQTRQRQTPEPEPEPESASSNSADDDSGLLVNTINYFAQVLSEPLTAEQPASHEVKLANAYEQLLGALDQQRKLVMQQVASGRVEIDVADSRMLVLRRLQKSAAHLVRSSHYLQVAAQWSRHASDTLTPEVRHGEPDAQMHLDAVE